MVVVGWGGVWRVKDEACGSSGCHSIHKTFSEKMMMMMTTERARDCQKRQHWRLW
jgi:hypothetical protein